MKVRKYEVTDFRNGIYYCPSCHRQIEAPFKGSSGNINIQSSVHLMCSNCKNGKIMITVLDKPITIVPSGVDNNLKDVV